MHPVIYQEFERICAENNVTGKVLEIGAIPSDLSLLCMKSLENASEKIGINLEGPFSYKDFKIMKGNANKIDFLASNTFDVVLCNAMLEHDKYFWKTISEIHRLTKPGGLIVIGTPGYTKYKIEGIKKLLKQLPFARYLIDHPYINALFTSTITFEIHAAPGDYYRFSPQTFKEVFFEGCTDVQISSVMLPPRIIGWGIISDPVDYPQ